MLSKIAWMYVKFLGGILTEVQGWVLENIPKDFQSFKKIFEE